MYNCCNVRIILQFQLPAGLQNISEDYSLTYYNKRTKPKIGFLILKLAWFLDTLEKQFSVETN